MGQKEFLTKIYNAGIEAGMTDAAARVTAAQAALESSYGKKAPGNNLFGIKAGKSWTGEVQMLNTWEGVGGKKVKIKAPFRKYATIEEAIADRVAFMDTRFPGFNQAETMDDAYVKLRLGTKSPYATDGVEAGDPLTYADKLNMIGGKLGDHPIPPGGLGTDSLVMEPGLRDVMQRVIQSSYPNPVTMSERTAVSRSAPARQVVGNSFDSKRAQSFVDRLGKAMDEALVVPKEMRPMDVGTPNGAERFKSVGADLMLGGSENLHLLAPRLADDFRSGGKLELPKPLMDGDNDSNRKNNMLTPLRVAEEFNRTPTQQLGYESDARLIKMAQDLQRAQQGDLRKANVVKTSGGIAGTSELPRDYKPSPSLMPVEKKRPVTGLTLPKVPMVTRVAARPEGPAAGMPAAKSKQSQGGIQTGAYKLPQFDIGLIKDRPKSVPKQQPTVATRPAGPAAGMPAAAKAPVPGLKLPVTPKSSTTTKTPVAAQPQIPPKSGLGMSQTTSKPAAKSVAAKPTPQQMAAMDSLAGLTTTPPKKPMPGIVEVKLSTVKTTDLPPAKPAAPKPVMSPVAPIPLTMSAETATKRKPLDLGLGLDPTKPATQRVTKKLEPKKLGADASPLDVIGDLLFGGGEKTIGSIGGLLNGDGPAKRGLLKPSEIDANIIGPAVKSKSGSDTYYPIQTKSGNTGFVNAKTGVKHTNDKGHQYGANGGSYGSSPGQSTKGLKPGDSVYNPDTNTWGLK